MAYAAADHKNGLISSSIMTDGGMRLVARAGLKKWVGLVWRTEIPSDAVQGDTFTLSVADGDVLSHGFCVNLKIMDSAISMVGQHTAWGSDRSSVFNLPQAASFFDFTFFSNTQLEEDVEFFLHPQLERGSVRTCWEPPAILAGGGQPKRP